MQNENELSLNGMLILQYNVHKKMCNLALLETKKVFILSPLGLDIFTLQGTANMMMIILWEAKAYIISVISICAYLNFPKAKSIPKNRRFRLIWQYILEKLLPISVECHEEQSHQNGFWKDVKNYLQSIQGVQENAS